jgi:hypothetical protein
MEKDLLSTGDDTLAASMEPNSSSDELEVGWDDEESGDELPTVEAGAFQVDEDVDLDSSKLKSLLTAPSVNPPAHSAPAVDKTAPSQSTESRIDWDF